MEVLSGWAALAALQLGLAITLDVGLPQLRDPDYGGKLARVRGRLRGDPPPATVVVLGSSRSLFAYQSARMESVLNRELGRPAVVGNFAVTGGGPVTGLLTWRRLQKDGVRADLVLVEVMPSFLGGRDCEAEVGEQRLPTDRLRWSDLALVERYGGARGKGVRREWRRGWVNAWYEHRLSLQRGFLPALLPAEQLAFNANGLEPCSVPDDLPPDFRARMLRHARDEYQALLASFRLGGPGCEALREMLADCRRRGAPAAMVLMPEGPNFQALYPPEAWRQLTAWLDGLSRETGAPVVNARDWCAEDQFLDSHHLVSSGAAAFTDRMGREQVVPLLRSLSRPPR
jgi:hypothetical protein